MQTSRYRKGDGEDNPWPRGLGTRSKLKTSRRQLRERGKHGHAMSCAGDYRCAVSYRMVTNRL